MRPDIKKAQAIGYRVVLPHYGKEIKLNIEK